MLLTVQLLRHVYTFSNIASQNQKKNFKIKQKEEKLLPDNCIKASLLSMLFFS